jgi:predicted small metal-binding protein
VRAPRSSRRILTSLTKRTKEHSNSNVVAKNCDWQVGGNGEEELMLLIEQHSREKHGLNLDDETRNGVHHAIHKRAA